MSELAVLRRQTKRYIAENPVAIVLNRSTKVSDGAGGTIDAAPTDLAPQTMRMIIQQTGVTSERRTVSGEMVTPDVVLLAAHDADIEEGDKFVWDGRDAEVVYAKDMRYEFLVEVAFR